PSRGADHSQGQASVLRDRSGALEPGLDRRGGPEQVGGSGNVADGRFDAFQTLLLAGCVQIEPDPTRPDHVTAEAAATQESGQVEEIASEAPTEGGGRQEPDVGGERPQVTGVVGQAFELEGDAAQHL